MNKLNATHGNKNEPDNYMFLTNYSGALFISNPIIKT